MRLLVVEGNCTRLVPASSRAATRPLCELLPNKKDVAAQPLLLAPQQVRDVGADLHILRAGHHPAFGAGGDDLTQRTPTNPRRRRQDPNIAAPIGVGTDQVNVDIGQPEKQ